MVVEASKNRRGADADAVQAVTDELCAVLPQAHLLLAFDRDGTLVPYADTPEKATIDPETVELIERLSRCANVTIAIVSARSIPLLEQDFGAMKIVLAGNYGVEIRFPGGGEFVHPVAANAVPRLKQLRDLAAPLALNAAAILEDHGYSLCLHWHTVPVEKRQQLHDQLEQLFHQFSDLKIRSLPTSYEVLPPMAWDKGMALQEIDKQLAASNHARHHYAFSGDSDADEPAFDWVNQRQGLSIKVGSAGESTCSRFQLSDTVQVKELLKKLAHCAV